MRILKTIALSITLLAAFAVLFILGVTSGKLPRAISNDTPNEFIEASKGLIEDQYVGNLALVLIEDGKVAETYFHDVETTIDRNTGFQVASVSKWVTAFGVFKLIQDGKVDLDTPIDDYLTRWHLPESEFDNREVTIRRLLSHSAGLVDDLGYDGFDPGERIQTIEESLTKAADSDYAEGVARVGIEPGTQYMYSGAGYTILQLLIEEVSGLSFQEYMTETVFKPLGMENSTFDLSTKPNMKMATFYMSDGSIATPSKFTALAAASLYTTAADLSKFMIAHVSANPVLNASTIETMMEAETFINNTPVYALGPHLYSQGGTKSNIIGHDGSSGKPTINTAARIDMKSKDGIIVLEMGSPNIASGIADEWLFVKAGIADFVVIQRNMGYLITIFAVGYLILLALLLRWRLKKK